MLFKPIIVPAPIICPKLVVANNSGRPNPFNPKAGIEGPNPLTCIAYLPNPIHKRLQITIIMAVDIDQEDVFEIILNKVCKFIFGLNSS